MLGVLGLMRLPYRACHPLASSSGDEAHRNVCSVTPNTFRLTMSALRYIGSVAFEANGPEMLGPGMLALGTGVSCGGLVSLDS